MIHRHDRSVNGKICFKNTSIRSCYTVTYPLKRLIGIFLFKKMTQPKQTYFMLLKYLRVKMTPQYIVSIHPLIFLFYEVLCVFFDPDILTTYFNKLNILSKVDIMRYRLMVGILSRRRLWSKSPAKKIAVKLGVVPKFT